MLKRCETCQFLSFICGGVDKTSTFLSLLGSPKSGVDDGALRFQWMGDPRIVGTTTGWGPQDS